MRRRGVVENRGDRKALAADAGFGSLSVLSILAGVLTAYGAFVLLLGVAVAIVDAVGIDTDLVTTDYEQLGVVGGPIVAALLLASYLFGGYVAGRMARRAGALNGLAVAVLGLVVAAAVAALVRWSADTESIVTSLRSLGVPTTADEYGPGLHRRRHRVAGSRPDRRASSAAAGASGGTASSWPAPSTQPSAPRRPHVSRPSPRWRAEQERTGSFERARTANPLRSRRADRDALAQPDRDVHVDPDRDEVDDARWPAKRTPRPHDRHFELTRRLRRPVP